MVQLLFAGGGGGGLGLGEFVFADFGTQDEAQGRYTSWTDLMAKLATIQIGAAPTVRLALTTGPFTVPLVGMPVGGWDMRGGSLTSFYGATGSVVLDCPPGVMFDNLFSIGGAAIGEGAVVLKIAPPAGTGVLLFSALPPGAPGIFVIGGGAGIDHSTDVGALIRSSGSPGSVGTVLVSHYSQQDTGVLPSLSGPLVEVIDDSGVVGVQIGTPLPTGWLVGGGPASALLAIYDLNSNADTLNPVAWVPGFTGGGGFTPIAFGKAGLVTYDDSAVAPPLGSTNVQGAIDALKAASSGAIGVWRPGTPTVPGVSYATFAEVYAACEPSRADIVFDPSLAPCIVPVAGGPWDFHGRMKFKPFRNVAASDVYQFEIADGAQVLDCAGIEGFTRCNVSPTAVYPFAFTAAATPTAPVFFPLTQGAIIDNHSVTLAAIDASTVPVAVFMQGLGAGLMDGPVVDVGATGLAILAFFDSSVFAGSGIAKGTPGSTVLIFTDALTGAPTPLDLPGFSGTLSIQQNALAQNVGYNDLAFSPPLGSTVVQGAIDALKLATKGDASGLLYMPTTSGDWAGDPSTVREAVDRLAAAVAGLLGTPIP